MRTKRKIVSATPPNAGVRNWYQRTLSQLLTDMYLDLSLTLGAAWTEEPATLNVRSPRLPLMASDAGISKTQKILDNGAVKWQRKFDRMSLSLSKKFADKNFRSTQTSMLAAFKQAGFTVRFKPTRTSLDAYKAVIAENVNLIKSIPAQYLTDVKSSVWNSVRAGGDMGTLSRKLKKTYDISTRRAALIARDQNAKATAIIENTRRQELGITKAIWQHSAGGKEPRPTHVAMNGKEFDLKTGMWDSDENEYVFPGQLINCRCTSRAIIPGFGD